MKKNIGTFDRVVRIIIGIACIVGSYFVATLLIKVVLIALGVFSIYEALVGWCAFYALIGRNTCPIE
ncbi:MAG: hypothetical protein RIT04_559 [Candidatus Parcubacteria bacterium]|jgi:hypothetical protein